MSNGIKSFEELYQESPGALRSEVDAALKEAVEGLSDVESGVTGAKITLVLSVKRGRHGRLDFSWSPPVKAIKRAAHEPCSYYVSPRGELVSEDPKQEKLPLGPVRSIKGGA